MSSFTMGRLEEPLGLARALRAGMAAVEVFSLLAFFDFLTNFSDFLSNGLLTDFLTSFLLDVDCFCVTSEVAKPRDSVKFLLDEGA